MAKLHTVIDDFQDGVINPAVWTSVIGTVSETGGRARLTPLTTFSFLKTSRIYDATNSQVVAHVPTVTANGGTGTLQCGMAIDADVNNYILIRKVAAQLVCTKYVAGVQTNLSFTPYSAVNHIFWRIRTDATNIYLETSPTGSGYFIQHTESIAGLGFALTSVGLYFATGYTGVEAFPGTLQIESVNPGLPIAAAGTSTSSGSLALAVTGPVQLTASGASTSSGSLSMMAVSPLDLTGNAASTSTGTLTFTIIPAGTLNLTASGASTSTGTLAITALVVTPGAFTASAASASSGTLDFSIGLAAGVYYFEPPIAYDLPPTLPEPTRPRYINAHAKWKGGQRRGRSVLKLAGTGIYPLATLFPDADLFPVEYSAATYIIIDTPTVDQMAAALAAYQGGHIYEVTPEEAAQLQMAGFTVTS